MSADEFPESLVNGSQKALGACWLVYGILRLALAVWLALFSGTATLMFGALLTRVPSPFVMMSEFHIVYAGIIVLSVLAGVFGLLAGVALLGGQGSARTLALIAAILSVSEIPLGATLGIYTLAVLFSARPGVVGRRS